MVQSMEAKSGDRVVYEYWAATPLKRRLGFSVVIPNDPAVTRKSCDPTTQADAGGNPASQRHWARGITEKHVFIEIKREVDFTPQMAPGKRSF